MAEGEAEYHWLSEAVVDFLRGPLYINPLMAFIDERCLLFTPEEENKLEYTQIHQDFKELVDNMLTFFLEELGVTPEAFYQVLASNQSKDKLSEFVVRTILTVDDFLLFKSMMVKRNIDLTNQVLAAMEEVRETAARGMEGTTATKDLSLEEEAKMLEAAMQLSQSDHANQEQWQEMMDIMRRMQMEDEDPAMIIAIANSLKSSNQVDSELADLEQAIALSLALEAEQKKMDIAASAASASAGAAITAGSAAESVKAKGLSLPVLPPVNLAGKAVAAELSAAAKKADAASGNEKSKPSRSDVIGGDENIMMASMKKQASMRGAAGFHSDGADREAVLKQKAELIASRGKLGKGGDGSVDEETAQKWMLDAKKKLVASKKLERDAEIADYKSGKKFGKMVDTGALMPAAKPSADDLEVKRAALREKLASKMKQDMLNA